nr:unnamed protein product [Digitaria exilis]
MVMMFERIQLLRLQRNENRNGKGRKSLQKWVDTGVVAAVEVLAEQKPKKVPFSLALQFPVTLPFTKVPKQVKTLKAPSSADEVPSGCSLNMF